MILYKDDWRNVRHDLSAQFPQLTDADIESAEGNEEKLLTRICERYGYERDRARRELDVFLNRHPAVDGPFDESRSQFNKEKQLVVQGGEPGFHPQQPGLHQELTPAEAAAATYPAKILPADAVLTPAEQAEADRIAKRDAELTSVKQAEANRLARIQAEADARKRSFSAPVVKKTEK